jgi:hypothetical protein
MGVPTSEVGYTSAMPRREDHEVHKGHVVALEKKTLVKQRLFKRATQVSVYSHKSANFHHNFQ